MAWLENWGYRRPITIDNTANPNSLTDYQIGPPHGLAVDTATLIAEGKMNADCSDVRFTDEDGTTLLTYHIVKNTENTANTAMWVKVPSIPGSGTKTIYMYYGNPPAVDARDLLTYEWYDDFEDCDVTDWVVGGTAADRICASDRVFEGGYDLRVRGGAGVWTIAWKSFTYPSFYAVNFYLNTTSVICSGLHAVLNAARDKHSILLRFYEGKIDYGSAGTWYTLYTTPSIDTWYFFRAKHDTVNDVVSYYVYDITYSLLASVENVAPNYSGVVDDNVNFNIGGEEAGAHYRWVDFVVITKATDPEPSATIGTEETPPAVSLSETMYLTDLVSKTPTKPVSELISLYDPTAVKAPSVVKVETLTLTDIISKSPSITKAETITLSDLRTQLATSKLLSELISLYDPTTAKTTSIIKAETLTLTDLIAKSITKILSETATLTDYVTALKVAMLVLSEVLSLYDPTVVKSVSAVKAETITLTDLIFKSSSITKPETITLSDLRTQLATSKLLSELVSLYDPTITKSITTVKTEPVTLADVYTRQVSYIRQFAETTKLSDVIAKTPEKPLTETITLTDLKMDKAVQKLLRELLTVTDLKIAKELVKAFTETIALYDYIAKTSSRILAETVALTDVLIVPLKVLLTERLTLTDKLEVWKRVIPVVRALLGITPMAWTGATLAIRFKPVLGVQAPWIIVKLGEKVTLRYRGSRGQS